MKYTMAKPFWAEFKGRQDKIMRIRNLLGAFLGGMLGIFGTQWFITDWYPAGGLVGVVGLFCGFFYKEVPVLILNELQKIHATVIWHQKRSRRILQMQQYRTVILERQRRERRHYKYLAFRARLIILHYGLKQEWAKFRQRVENMHFTERALVIRFAAAGSYCLINMLVIVNAQSILGLRDSPLIAFAYIVAWSNVWLTMGPINSKYKLQPRQAKLALYNDTYERFLRSGWNLYFWYLRTFFHNEVRTLILAVAVAVCAFLAATAGSVAVVPILLGWVIVKGLRKALRKRAYLLCLSVTTITVLTVALLAREYMEGNGLLVAALATGITAGIATEVLRAVINQTVPLRTQARILRFPVKKFLLNSTRRCLDLGRKVIKKVEIVAPELIEIPNLAK